MQSPTALVPLLGSRTSSSTAPALSPPARWVSMCPRARTRRTTVHYWKSLLPLYAAPQPIWSAAIMGTGPVLAVAGAIARWPVGCSPGGSHRRP